MLHASKVFKSERLAFSQKIVELSKSTVNLSGEVFESPNYCGTLRQAEHAAAEVVALNMLSRQGPFSVSCCTDPCKSVQELVAGECTQRAGVSLSVYTTTRHGPGHLPVFKCTVRVADLEFQGEAGKTKKQAEKNAAMAAWLALKKLSNQGQPTTGLAETEVTEEQERNLIAQALAAAFYKEGSIPSMQPLPHPSYLPIGVSLPPRIRDISSMSREAVAVSRVVASSLGSGLGTSGSSTCSELGNSLEGQTQSATTFG
ncbi:unnamed protein product [Sphagnum troendelagicum]|uniref:DRBM domain-containing protein n=1 Tax=Sphagnum troendelagicum TaxID=128251 RepID=A0ABP0V1B4_9BRYO